MSLAEGDLKAIRGASLFNAPRRLLVRQEIKALENEVKEIYEMLSGVQELSFTDQQFHNLTLEQKLLTLNAELQAAAKRAGIELPSA